MPTSTHLDRCARFSLLIALLAFMPSLQAADAGASARILSAVFTDHAVLQRACTVPVWGTAAAGAEVVVAFAGQRHSTHADADGHWRVALTSMDASAIPRDLTVQSGSDTVTCSDILVGEVWLCSGQSNMTMSVASSAHGPEEIAAADHPLMRLYTVEQHPSLTAVDEPHGSWVACSARTVGDFSAAAYYFGRTVCAELGVPVGLIHASVGGTPIEAWTRVEVLGTMPAVGARALLDLDHYRAQPEATRRFPLDRTAWEERWQVQPPARTPESAGWEDVATAASGWTAATLPATWDQLGFHSGGVFWARKVIDLPPAAAGRDFTLKLLWMTEQYDTAYWNGEAIGHSGNDAPDYYFGQRAYRVPGKLVHAGRNVLAVRIVSASEKSGLWSWGRKLEVPVDDPETIDDTWVVRQESHFAPLPEAALSQRPRLTSIPFRSVPGALYNGMIHPLIPYAVRGAIWYQGESNAGRAGEYRQLLSLMISDWREHWGEGAFPFLIQQLANNERPESDANKPAAWAFLREAQLQVADQVPGCGIAIGIDLGSRDTIHPLNKQEVGRRLALVALEKTYGRAVPSSGPRFAGIAIENGSIRVHFLDAQGLSARGGPLQRFALAGDDHVFVWADARIEGDTVVVTSAHVAQPRAVRYAWAENPEGCNLVNQSGLPAAPFRSDTW